MSAYNTKLEDAKDNNRVIQCQSCFRTFCTPAQFGQHSRSCGEQKCAHQFRSIGKQAYKYSYLEKQSDETNSLEIKTRFLIESNVKSNGRIDNWKQLSQDHQLRDRNFESLLKSNQIENVRVAVRNRKESGLVVANFVRRDVAKTAEQVHAAKLCIERAVDIVRRTLPSSITLTMHACRYAQCNELVIRDTEGFCSRHRAQKYHHKTTTKVSPTPTPAPNLVNIADEDDDDDQKTEACDMRQQTQQQHQTQQQCDDTKLQFSSASTPPHPHDNRLIQRPHERLYPAITTPSVSVSPSLFTPPCEDIDDTSMDLCDMDLCDDDLYNCPLKPAPVPLRANQPDERMLRLSAFFAQHCYVFQTPPSLCNVSIKDSLLTQNGLNLLSVNYATHVPDPRQILRKDDYLVTIGLREHVEDYLRQWTCSDMEVDDGHGADTYLVDREKSIRFKQFMGEMITYYIMYVAVPSQFYNCTLSHLPFARFGVNVISVNLKMEHQCKLSQARLKPNDMLLCSFPRADDKHQTFCQIVQSMR